MIERSKSSHEPMNQAALLHIGRWRQGMLVSQLGMVLLDLSNGSSLSALDAEMGR